MSNYEEFESMVSYRFGLINPTNFIQENKLRILSHAAYLMKLLWDIKEEKL